MSATQPSSGQRGISPVAGNAKPVVSRKALSVGVIAVCAGVLGVLAWRSSNPPEHPTKEKLPEQLGAVVPYQAPPMVIPPQPVPKPAAPPPQPQARPEPPPPPPQQQLLMPRQDPVARVTSSAVSSVAPPAPPKPYMLTFAEPPRPTAVEQRGGGSGQSRPDTIPTVTYAATKLDGIKAALLGDQTFMLSPGLTPCILDTAVDSTFEGPIECHIPFDIKPHGVTLLDRGSVVHGWYHNNVRDGQARLFVVADWVEDKATGCAVKFDNVPMADSTGMAGVEGNVDQHIWQRIGAAMLLTVGASGESLAQAALSKGGNTYLSFNGSTGGMDQVANAILQRSMNIPPTITLHQGQAISVFVTKPLDFSPCYDLRTKD
jgi:type IV secretion system protein VirB10